jgi:hypothetical protein
MEQIHLHPLKITLETSKPKPVLLTGGLGVDHLPRKSAGLDLGARK